MPLRGGAVAELICDSIHVDPSLVRDVYGFRSASTSSLITDAMQAAGMADGSTRSAQDVIVKDGALHARAGGTPCWWHRTS